MPLDKFVLILVLVMIAAGLTVLLAAVVVASVSLPWLGATVALPVALVGYVVVRVIADRMSSREDRHYDNIEK